MTSIGTFWIPNHFCKSFAVGKLLNNNWMFWKADIKMCMTNTVVPSNFHGIPDRQKEQAGAELCQAQGKLRLAGLLLFSCSTLID